MPDTNEWRPKVGERVAVYGEVTRFVDESGEVIAVRYRDNIERWVDAVNVSPLSTPAAREPWGVLREAANIMAANSWLNAPEHLRTQADRLEAAARPAPQPTLTEAVRAWFEKPSFSRAEAMKEALARAVEAERERDEARGHIDAVNGEAGKLLVDHDNMREALATARADALREASDVCLARMKPDSAHEAPYNAEDLACSKAILALIPEKPHVE